MRLPVSVVSRSWFDHTFYSFYRSVIGRSISKAIINNKIRTLFERDYAYIEYEEQSGRLFKMICGIKGKTDFGVSSLFISPFFFHDTQQNDDQYRQLFSRLKDARLGCQEFYICIRENQRRERQILEDLGSHLDAIQLVGNIRDTLSVIGRKQPAFEDHVTVTQYNDKRDWLDLIDAHVRARESGPKDNRCDATLSANQKKLRSFWKSVSKNPAQGASFVVRENGIFLGAIRMVYFKEPFMKKAAHVGDIIIAPESQGKGLSYFLYGCALRSAFAKGKRVFTGATTTKRVLDMAAKMKRHPIQWYYRVPVSIGR